MDKAIETLKEAISIESHPVLKKDLKLLKALSNYIK